jgi:hypothetical protein
MSWICWVPPPAYNGGISSSPGWKWWQTILEIEISCSQWEGSNGLSFLHLGFGRGGGEEGYFFGSQCVPKVVLIKFWKCSHQVLNVFPKMFPIAPHLLSHIVLGHGSSSIRMFKFGTETSWIQLFTKGCQHEVYCLCKNVLQRNRKYRVDSLN